MNKINTFKAPCPTCKVECNTLVHGEKKQEWADVFEERYHVYGEVEHKLLECCGCGTVFYYKDSWDSEGGNSDRDGNFKIHHDIETVPTQGKPSTKPEWVGMIYKKDKVLSNILDEVYTSYEHEALILASIGLRTAFDRVCDIIGIPAHLGMEQKVRAVFGNGFVSETEREQLRIVTDAGNAAAHRGWMPDSEAFESLLHVTEKFIHNVVLRDHNILDIGKQIPKRQKKNDN